MADTENTMPATQMGKTQEDIENELSVGKFGAQQARTFGFLFGGMAAGGAAGYGLTKTKLTDKVAGWVPKVAEFFGNKHSEETGEALKAVVHEMEHERKMGIARGIIIGATTFVGTMGGQIASLYEHWVKVERQRLGVQEVNKDVATLMQKRMQFEQTLDKQQQLIDDMLQNSGQPGPLAAKELERREAATTASVENLRS